MAKPALIRIRLLGGLHLQGPGDVDMVMSQPKRAAILAFLAAHSTGGAQRRDRLLALFWPESDERRARLALNSALYFLRTALGDEVLVSPNRDEVGLNPGRVWCDLSAFHAALEDGRPELALELYAGDLLAGFLLGGNEEFDHWAELERERVRRRALQAASALADRAEADALPDAAIRYARQAMELAPGDERMLRRLMLLLEKVGDRSGAFEAYTAFADRIARAYELEPSPETQELLDRVRRAEHAARSAPAPVPELAPAPARAGEPRPMLVAVLPFAFRGAPELAYLGEGIVDLLATALDDVGEVRTVDPRAIVGLLARMGGDSADPAAARRVTEHFGAQAMLLGSITEIAGRVQFTAALYRAGEMDEPVFRTDVQGAVSEIFTMIDTLSRRVLAEYYEDTGARLASLAVRTTSSSAALHAYLEGEQALRRGRYLRASVAFSRAVGEDPEFALAYYRLSIGQAWCLQVETVSDAAETALRHAARLGARDRALLEAHFLWRRGSAAEAERIYRDLLTAYPEDVEARLQLAEVLFHYRLPRGYPVPDVRRAFQVVLALEPYNLEAMLHLARLAARDARIEELALYRQRLSESALGERRLELAALTAVAANDPQLMSDVLAELRTAGIREIVVCATNVANNFELHHSVDFMSSLLRLFTEPSQTDESRAFGHAALAILNIAKGRGEAAEGELAAAERLNEAVGMVYRGYFALLPFIPRDPKYVHTVRERITAWQADAVPFTDHPVKRAMNGTYPLLREYLLGMLAARLEDWTAAELHAARIDAMAPAFASSLLATLPRALAGSVRAHAAWANGDAHAALDHLGTEPAELNYLLAACSPIYFQLHEQYLRGVLFRELGRLEEARAAFSSFEGQCYLTYVDRPVAVHALEQMEEAAGRAAEAARLRATFRGWWEEPDPELMAALA